jgi:hypothetical protein
MVVSGQRHAPAALCPRGKDPPGTHCTGGWVGTRAGADTEVRGKILLRLPEIEPLSPGRPVRSQTVYWLSNPGSLNYFLEAVYCEQPNKLKQMVQYSSVELINTNVTT